MIQDLMALENAFNVTMYILLKHNVFIVRVFFLSYDLLAWFQQEDPPYAAWTI